MKRTKRPPTRPGDPWANTVKRLARELREKQQLEKTIHCSYTPGPWDYDLDYIVAPDPSGRHPDIYIAEIAHEDNEGRIAPYEQHDANRRLIAAAPELLEALQHARSRLNQIPHCYADTDFRLIERAIAKATGGAHDLR